MRRSTLHLAVPLLLAALAAGVAAQPGGSISGVVVAGREDPQGNEQLLLTLPPTADGRPVDGVAIALGRKLVANAEPWLLPDGWTLDRDKGSVRLGGKPLGEKEGFVRIGLERELPGNLELELFSGGIGLGRKKIAVLRYPPLDQAPLGDGAPKPPPAAAAGDTLGFRHLWESGWKEASDSWLAGGWTVGGQPAVPVGPTGGSSQEGGSEEFTDFSSGYTATDYKIGVDWDLTVGSKLDFAYETNWGEKIDLGVGVRINYDWGTDLQPTGPALNSCTSMVFAGRSICLCGWFPEEVRGNTIYLDGKPIGTADSSSSTTMTIRIPDYIEPGFHMLTVEGARGDAMVSVVELGGEIDQSKLFSGESTPIRLFLRGTNESVGIRLRNMTPGIITLGGGDEQVIKTSGGSENSWTGTVTGTTPGEFNLVYELELGDCPCAEDGVQEFAEVTTYENLYEETFASYRRGRDLANESQYSDPEGTRTAHDIARESLQELERTRKRLRDGQRAWDAGDEGGVGPSTARSFERLIEEAETQARNVLAQPDTPGLAFDDTPGDDPRDTPAPTIYGEEIDPPWIRVTDGWFEPTQGVWQDDDYFEDKPTKRLTNTGPATWKAELDMVANRQTVVFGIKPDGRNRIKMQGRTTYSRLAPVRFRLKLRSGSGDETIWTQDRAENHIRIDGPAGGEVDWAASLMVQNGLPLGFRTFKIPAGAYTLVMELIREDGSSTGLEVKVSGNSVNTSFPTVNFAPTMLSDPKNDSDRAAVNKARLFRGEAKELLERAFPLPLGSVTTVARPLQDLRAQAPGTLRGLLDFLPGVDRTEKVARDAVIAHMVQRYGTDSQLGSGGKTFVILQEHDFPISIDSESAAAFAPSEKVVIGQPSNTNQVVLHELMHTIRYIWSADQMASECGFSYHNSADNNYGNGVEIHAEGFRFRRDGVPAMMGPVTGAGWMTQCSYWHLLKLLQGGVDPDLLVMRAYLARSSDGQHHGVLAPAFQKLGVADLDANDGTVDDWAFVLRDRQGAVLATYPFRAVWRVPDTPADRAVVPITYSIEELPGTATIELVGPDGVADTLSMSANAPTVEITTPATAGAQSSAAGTVTATWRGADADGDDLTYLVFYSPDNGANWRMVADELTATTFEVPVTGTPAGPRIRVVVTDGVRSDVAEVPFRLTP